MAGYGVIYGGDAEHLIRRFGASALSAIRRNGIVMQTAASSICLTFPIRKIVLPYVDMLQLADPDKAPFWGERILFFCTEKEFTELKYRLKKEAVFPAPQYRMAYAPDDNVPALSRLLRGPRWTPSRLQTWQDWTEPAPAHQSAVLMRYMPKTAYNAMAHAMNRRACSRAELAFGEIACRMIMEQHGELLLCSGGVLIFSAEQEAAELLKKKISRLFCEKMLAYCEGKAIMPKITDIKPTEKEKINL